MLMKKFLTLYKKLLQNVLNTIKRMKSPLNFGSTGFPAFWYAPIVALDIVIIQGSPRSMMPSVVAIKPVGPVKRGHLF